jgi:hypothetical protein
MTGYMTDEYRERLEYAYKLFGTFGCFTAVDIRAKATVMNVLKSKGYIRRDSTRGPWRITEEGEDYVRKYLKHPEKVENDWEARQVFDGGAC